MAAVTYFNIRDAAAGKPATPTEGLVIELMRWADQCGPITGPGPLLSALITAYAHLAHANGMHEEAKQILQMVSTSLDNPETMRIQAERRA